MHHQIENLALFLEKELQIIEQQSNPHERLNQAYKLIETAVSEVKSYLEDHRFETDLEEILFFKKTNPEILSHWIEEGLRYNLTINKPIGTTEILINYFDEEIKCLQGFFRLNAFYYQYYKNEFKELDSVYFLRSSGPLPVPLPEIPDIYSKYSTAMSYQFARFKAYERTQYFILQQIENLKNHSTETYAGNPEKSEGGKLKWTGEIINLVELAYGIWLTGQLNNGNASLNQIVRWLELNLFVNVGIIQKRFSEIERRKRLSFTKYLDQMREVLLQKLKNGNN